MSIDETKILSIWSNMQTWTILLIIKIAGTLMMMAFRIYANNARLNKRYRINKVSLIVEVSIGIILILVGVIMSQINIP